MRYALGDRRVVMRGNGQWIAPNAVLIGDIVLAADVSVWWGAVLRADEDRITIGAATNIQDESVLHVDPGHPLTIGDRVTVGHRAMLHGCRVGDGALIGIGATILNDAVIGRHCIVGAQALITENKRFPERSVVEGVPGKVVREVTDAEVD
jgi:carbonic anhydrase/acetyltransferase-like protein (isoleucine patch superfamily)